MSNYLYTSAQVVAKDTYSSYYQRATVDVEVTASGVVNWKITMTNDYGDTLNESEGRGRAVSLYVSIGGTEVYNAHINYADSNTSKWRTFPTGHDTSKSGSFTTTADSLSIVVGVCCMQTGIANNGVEKSHTLVRRKWTDVVTGSTSIVDNYNNTFTITATKGSDGDYNTAGGPTNLKWGYDTNRTSTYTSGTPISLTISGTSDTRRVYAESTTTATYGDSKKATDYEDIKQYIAPNAPTNPKLTWTKTRLTLKESWALEWTASTAKNTNSPVSGYRIRFWVNGKTIPFKEKKADGTITTLTTTAGSDLNHANKYYYDREIANTKMTPIDPVLNGLKVGDEIYFSISSYTKDGKNNKLHSSSAVTSPTYTVQNAGILQVRTSSGWKEGQVWIKTSDSWKEAESVNVRTSSGWKESE